MSGFEIAGLVFGVFPLIINTLEGCKNSLETVENWWTFSTEFIQFQQEVEYQWLFFQDHIRELFSPGFPPGTDTKEIFLAIRNLHGNLEARNLDLENLLRDQLSNGYGVYWETFKNMDRTINKLMGKLNIDSRLIVSYFLSFPKRVRILFLLIMFFSQEAQASDGTLKVGKAKKLEYEFKRIRFTLQKRKRESLLSQLESYNEKLEKLRQRGLNSNAARSAPIEEPESRRARIDPLEIATFKRIQEQALCFHHAISKSWNCKCPSAHSVNLMLEKRTRSRGQTNGTDRSFKSNASTADSDTRFKVLFLFEADRVAASTFPTWQETEFVLSNGSGMGSELGPVLVDVWQENGGMCRPGLLADSGRPSSSRSPILKSSMRGSSSCNTVKPGPHSSVNSPSLST